MAKIVTTIPPRTSGQWEDGTPYEYTGLMPVQEPVLTGVDQFLLLDDEWVIVSINNLDAQYDEINSLSGGQLDIERTAWLDSTRTPPYGDPGNGEQNPNPDYTARNDMWDIVDFYQAEARKNVGEYGMRQPTYYEISSTDDPVYNPAKLPSLVTTVLVSEGGYTRARHSRISGNPNMDVFKVDYNLNCYIKFPTRMVDGSTYVITLNNGNNVIFSYDLNSLVSRAIKVNQVGYLPDAGVKKAHLGADLYEYGPLDLSHTTTYEIINTETQQVAYSGNVTLNELNPLFGPGSSSNDDDPMYGEDVYDIDFSGMTETGTFFIKVPGVGRSWPFKHSADALDYAFYTSCRGLFHQRGGTAITEPYSHWTRRRARMDPKWYECENLEKPEIVNRDLQGNPPEPGFPSLNAFQIVGYTTDFTKRTTPVPGGWHDAADWDFRAFHYAVMYDLLNAFTINAGTLGDDQLDIPESGNGVPDILSEVRYGLEFYRATQNQEGAVGAELETNTHPNIDSFPGVSWNDRRYYAIGTRNRWTTLQFAAAAAQYARLVKPFDSVDSALYEAAAVLAYNWGNTPANSLGVDFIVNAAPDQGRGAPPYTVNYTELDSDTYHYLLHARLQLYLLTLDSVTYLINIDFLIANIPGPYDPPFLVTSWGQWIHFAITEAEAALPTQAATARAAIITKADTYVTKLADSPYQMSWTRSKNSQMSYGASYMPIFTRPLFMAHYFTSIATYRDAAIQNLDFVLGCNPMGMSWTTGIGYVYPVDIQHAPSQYDSIMDPVPGITIYGINNGGAYGAFKNDVWRADSPTGGAILSLSQVNGIATAVTAVEHGLTDGDRIVLDGAIPGGGQREMTGYNVAEAATVTGLSEFQFPVDSSIDATATGNPIWYHDFVTDFSIRNPPTWRRWYSHPSLLVAQNEFTVGETISPTVFACAVLYSGSSQAQNKPRPSKYLHGWYLI